METIRPEVERAPAARLGDALRVSVRAGWDRLGTLIAVSLTWTALTLVPLLIGQALPLPAVMRGVIMLIASVLSLSAPTAGACYVAYLICSHDEVSYADFWRGAARLAGPATRLGLIQLVVTGVLGINLWFYLHLGHLFGTVAALLCGYLLLFWGMMAVYHYPLLVAQETGLFDEPERTARRGAAAVLRRGFYLALGSPLYTLGLLGVVLVVTAVCLGIVVLTPLLMVGAESLLVTQACRMLLMKYGVLPHPPKDEEIIPDEKFRIK